MRNLLPLLFLAFAACDSAGDAMLPNIGVGEVLYRTDLVDRALGAAALPDGSLVVAGSTEGVLGLGDWTNAFPLLLRVSAAGTLADTAVYRDVRYGEALAVAPFEDGLAVLVADANYDENGFETPNLTLYHTRADGTREGVLYERADAFPAQHPLLRTADGGLLLVLSRSSVEGEDLVKLDEAGGVVWTYRMPEVQNVVDVEEGPGGDLFVLGVRDDSRRFDLARLSPSGQEAWQRTYGDDTVRGVVGVAAAGDGAAILSSLIGPGEETIVVTGVTTTGEVRWEREHVTGRATASALSGLPDGGYVFGYAEQYGTADSGIGQTRAYVVRLSADGTEQWRRPFGPPEGTTAVRSIVPLVGSRFAAAGSTGPAFIDGYGEDDFDVLTVIYNAGGDSV